jgi:alanine-synthesizing transaminase
MHDRRGPLSSRSAADATPNRLASAIAARRASGARLLDLTEGNPTAAAIPYDESLLRALASKDALRYSPEPLGMRSAREAVAAEWAEQGIAIAPERIVLTASTSEAYSYLMHALSDPHDEWLIPAPGYPLVAHLAQIAGVHLSHAPLSFGGGRWAYDPASIYDAIREHTRVVSVVAPNNPTGSMLTSDDLDALAAFGLPIVSDEVFARYPLEPPDGAVSSVLSRPPETLTFAIGGLSKTAALPQMKLAWIGVAGPDDLVAEAIARLELIADTFLSVATPVQLALPHLLSTARVARDAIGARCRRNLDALRSRIRGSAVTVPRIDGGWYAPLRVPATRTDEEWSLALVERGVLVHPGFFFDFPDENVWLIASLLTPPAIFDEGIDALVAIAGE